MPDMMWYYCESLLWYYIIKLWMFHCFHSFFAHYIVNSVIDMDVKTALQNIKNSSQMIQRSEFSQHGEFVLLIIIVCYFICEALVSRLMYIVWYCIHSTGSTIGWYLCIPWYKNTILHSGTYFIDGIVQSRLAF